MALGGVLRAAIRAGRFGEAARQSRRQARALRSLNETGGVGRFQRQLPFEERGFERMSGRAFGATPRGNAVVVDPATGRRTVLNQNFDDFMEAGPLPRSPIAAPYEDFRVIPSYSPMYTPEYRGGPMPALPSIFMGRPISSRPAPLRKRPAFEPDVETFFFDDITGASGFTDPYTGFRFTPQGFPLD